jgi:hypothetical protein
MTIIQLPASRAAALTQALAELGVRQPSSIEGVPKAPLTLTWEPDLTPEEQASVDTVVRLSLSGTLLSPADYAALAPRLAALRTFRQQSQSEFMAKTANARDRELFDAMNDVSAILLRMLRD